MSPSAGPSSSARIVDSLRIAQDVLLLRRFARRNGCPAVTQWRTQADVAIRLRGPPLNDFFIGALRSTRGAANLGSSTGRDAPSRNATSWPLAGVPGRRDAVECLELKPNRPGGACPMELASNYWPEQLCRERYERVALTNLGRRRRACTHVAETES